MRAFDRDFSDLHGEAWPPLRAEIVLEATPRAAPRDHFPRWQVRRPANPIPWSVRASWALTALLLCLMLGMAVLAMLAIGWAAIFG